MRAKPSSMHLFCANVLAVALLATRVVIAELADGVAVDTLIATPTPVMSKRYLQSYADITTSDNAEDFGERANIPGVATSLESVTTVPKLQAWWWKLLGQTPESLIGHLNLGKKKHKLFENPDFFKWVAHVKRIALKDKKDPFDMMIMALKQSRQYNDEAVLTEILLTAPEINIKESTAAKLLDAQFNSWEQRKNHAGDIFKWLMLDKTKLTELHKTSNFIRWIGFVEKSYALQPRGKTVAIYDALLRYYKTPPKLAEIFFSMMKDKGMEKTAFDLLKYSIANWEHQQKYASDVFKWLKLNETKSAKLFESPFFRDWVDFANKSYTKQSGAATKAMFNTLSAHYADADLTKVLAAGLKVKGMETIARELLDAQKKSKGNLGTAN